MTMSFHFFHHLFHYLLHPPNSNSETLSQMHQNVTSIFEFILSGRHDAQKKELSQIPPSTHPKRSPAENI